MNSYTIALLLITLFSAAAFSPLLGGGLRHVRKISTRKPSSAPLKMAYNGPEGDMKLLFIMPTFGCPDGITPKLLDYMKQCVESTDKEPKTDCVFYGWDVSADGTKLYCREAYTSPEALINHLNTAGGLVGKMIEDCGLSLDKFEIVCQKKDYETLAEPCAAFGAVFRFNAMGFDNVKYSPA